MLTVSSFRSLKKKKSERCLITTATLLCTGCIRALLPTGTINVKRRIPYSLFLLMKILKVSVACLFRQTEFKLDIMVTNKEDLEL